TYDHSEVLLLQWFCSLVLFFFFSSRRRHTRFSRDWSSDVCSSDLVLTTASEYGTGMIRTTMVACPARARVLAAKAVVFFLVAFVVTLVSVSLVALLHVAMLEGSGARAPSGEEWLKGTVGISLYLALLRSEER